MPSLQGLWIYPIKSLDGVARTEALLLASGALEHDRRWALFDSEGYVVNAKRTDRVHRLRAQFDDSLTSVTLSGPPGFASETFALRDEQRLALWFSDYFQMPVTLHENPQGGFPDDTDASGPTVVSTATLETVAAWFPGMSVDECRRRIRANLEIGGVEPFWEDRLFAAVGEAVPFQVGSAQLLGVNPCQRCVVPSRQPDTGDPWSGFQAEFARRRQATLPAWADRARFDHYYRLSTNTRPASPVDRSLLRVGDPVRLL